MRKYTGILLVILLAIVMAGCNQTNEKEDANTESKTDIESKAEEFIALLSEGDYEKGWENFDKTMKEGISSTELEELWETLNDQAGEFIDQEYNSTEKTNDGYEVVYISGLFEATDVIFTVTFDKDEKIAGFYIK